MKFLEVHSDMETKRNKAKAKTAIGGPWGLRYKHAGRSVKSVEGAWRR